jgi:hypothetical protein
MRKPILPIKTAKKDCFYGDMIILWYTLQKQKLSYL